MEIGWGRLTHRGEVLEQPGRGRREAHLNPTISFGWGTKKGVDSMPLKFGL